MLHYIAKRLLLIIPTLLGILAVNFFIIQFLPGGPVEQMMAEIQGHSVLATSAASGSQSLLKSNTPQEARGRRGLEAEYLKTIEKMYGFDQPPLKRFWILLKNYATFNFGESYMLHKSVIELIREALPVSISLGLWSTLLIYLISIPLGIRKAVRKGSSFDFITSIVVTVAHAIPAFMLAVGFIVYFRDSSWLMVSGLTSPDFESLSFLGKINDYARHIILPVITVTIGGFAALTILTKNSFLEHLHKQYVITARAKGLSEKKILYRHIFRNAMIIVISGFPAAFMSLFFTSSLLIEFTFNLRGLGLLGYNATLSRDYPVMFATLFIFTLLGLIMNLICDLVYCWIDPRIDFEAKK